MPDPTNLAEAVAAGHTILEGDEKDQALATFGVPSAPDCSTLPPGHKCGETDCIGGFKLVLYCDDTKGRTVHVKTPC
jgi:hypothetical protein